MGRPPKLRLTSWLGSSASVTSGRAAKDAPPRAGGAASPRPAGDAAPMLRRLRTKFIGLNMALAALVLAASFATIC